MPPQSTTFYVYVLCRPNNKPFYVGKGKGKRVFEHEQDARRGHRCQKCNTIRKIWREGGEVLRYTVFTTNDEAEAYAYEAELIALYGRNTLANASDGGAGSITGTKHSAKTLAKMRAAAAKRPPVSDAQRERMRIAAQSRPPISEETRAKMRKAHAEQIHHPMSAAEREKRRANYRPVSEETRQKMREAARNRPPRSDEVRKKVGEALRTAHQTGLHHAKHPARHIITTPEGDEVLVNFTAFCREHGLSFNGMMHAVRTGATHKGYKARRVTD